MDFFKRFVSEFRTSMITRLNKKTGWGKIEVLKEIDDALLDQLSGQLDLFNADKKEPTDISASGSTC